LFWCSLGGDGTDFIVQQGTCSYSCNQKIPLKDVVFLDVTSEKCIASIFRTEQQAERGKYNANVERRGFEGASGN
jgi:hypothetical protein